MTLRLYWEDPYLWRFTARVVEETTYQGQPAVILDRTAFYPAGGGQPSDRGTLNGIPVREVMEREEDGVILHILERPLGMQEVEGIVDGERRFDHMQQHTGQHILSQAFLRVAGAQTVSFHIGHEVVTIDLEVADLPEAIAEAAEELANRVVLENREVRTRWVGEEDVGSLGLRRSPSVGGPIRIVEVADFDRSPCGGTHVRRTGEVGPIKILRWERRGGGVRVSFLCGWRALRDYQGKHRRLLQAARLLSAGEADLTEAVQALQRAWKEAQRSLSLLQEVYIEEALPILEREALPTPFGELVIHVWAQLPPGLLPRLARRLSASGPRLVILAAGGSAGLLAVACGPGIPVSAQEVLERIRSRLGFSGGGGRSDYAQAPLPPTISMADLRKILERVREELRGGGTESASSSP
jgi:alanyl-tRNA synthetase